jgi:hypothetical protein
MTPWGSKELAIYSEAVQQTTNNIIALLQDFLCKPDGCLDPSCKSMVEAIKLIQNGWVDESE